MEHLSQLRRLGLFDAKVPRYTSYPPATKFSNDVTGDVFRSWVGQIPEGSAISVYAHVPFCRRLCWFCACRTQGTRSDAPVIAYVQTLSKEVENLKAILPKGVRIARLHWGGGTPTLLQPDMMRTLAGHDHRGDAAGRKRRVLGRDRPQRNRRGAPHRAGRGGMNRASIGVQDFDDDIQQAIGRIQGYEVTRDTVEALRAHGIQSLNADILYGLPHQNQARIAESVQMLLSLSPDRVALYGYAHVPWMAKRQAMIPTDALPTPEERLHLFNTARRLFLWDGYDEIGIDHFARPTDSMAVAARTGHLRRNFQGYTDDTCDVLIGLGASAISKFPQGFAQNASATAQYQASVREGEMATGRGHIFKGEDMWRGRMIEMLLCDSRSTAPRSSTRSMWTRDALRPLPGRRASLSRHDAHHAEGFEIVDEGRPLARMIARAFDGYEMRAEGHSAAF
jgi:oxygen-independent coproporphyrinogen-3 oxidase